MRAGQGKEIADRITKEITETFGSSSKRTAAAEPDDHTPSDPAGKRTSSVRRGRNSAS